MNFLWEYIKHPTKIGAIAPSSRGLAEKMIQNIDFEHSECIVELGPGTGVFSEFIINNIKNNTMFILIEQNEKFCEFLRKKFDTKNAIIINGDAGKVSKILNEFQIEQVNYVISGLPFSSFPKKVSENIFTEIQKILGESGKFITFQYTLLHKKMFRKWFDIENICFQLLNLPSAYVIEMKNKEMGENK